MGNATVAAQPVQVEVLSWRCGQCSRIFGGAQNAFRLAQRCCATYDCAICGSTQRVMGITDELWHEGICLRCSYDRRERERWLAAEKTTSPKHGWICIGDRFYPDVDDAVDSIIADHDGDVRELPEMEFLAWECEPRLIAFDLQAELVERVYDQCEDQVDRIPPAPIAQAQTLIDEALADLKYFEPGTRAVDVREALRDAVEGMQQ
jgi:hypothetical protein